MEEGREGISKVCLEVIRKRGERGRVLSEWEQERKEFFLGKRNGMGQGKRGEKQSGTTYGRR